MKVIPKVKFLKHCMTVTSKSISREFENINNIIIYYNNIILILITIY